MPARKNYPKHRTVGPGNTHFNIFNMASRLLLDMEYLEKKLIRISEPEAAADARWAQISLERIVAALRPYLPLPPVK